MDPITFKPGENVFATIKEKEIGPLYLVQIDGGMATLQGAESHVVPVKDLIRVAP